MSAHPGLVAALVATLFASCSSTDGADLRLAYLQTAIHGDVALGPSTGGSADGSNDVRGDLSLGDDNHTVLLAGVVPTPAGRFGASMFWFDQSGTGTLGADFGDIPSGTLAQTETEFWNIKTYWVYDLIRTENVRLAPGVAVDFVDLEMSAQSTAAARTYEKVEMFAPIPLLFLDGDARFGRFVVAAQGGGMAIDLEDGDGLYWDFEGRIGFVPREDLELFAGYRFLSMDIDGVADSRTGELDLQVHGWFVGGAYRF